MKRKHNFKLLLSLLVLFVVIAAGTITNAYTYPFQDPSLATDVRVDDLVSRLTLAEKISQMGNTAPAISRLGIASYEWWSEALHGVARSGLATVFPQAIAMSSTWDPALINNMASATSDEARVKSNTTGKGLSYWSPTINMARDPRWGRAEENYGEDTYLASQIAVNFVKGMQGSDPKYLKTVSTAKHFACNNSEYNRHNGSSTVDDRSLREYYLPTFKACVVDGKVFSIMSAYNAVNGIPCSCNTFLLTDTLRTEWGFQGYVVSDCDAVSDIYASHHYVATAAEASGKGVKAGCDLNCGGTYQNNLNSAISSGYVTEADINVAVKRLFKARILLGEFDPPSMVPYTSIPATELDCQAHRDLALQTARESIVLLKNTSNRLPLSKTINSVAVIGPNADICQFGGYSGTPSFCVTPVMGIEDKLNGTNPRKEAESFSSQSGVQVETCAEGGQSLGYIENGDYTVYNSIDLTGKTGFKARVATANPGGNIEVRLDSLTGTLVGTCAVTATGGWQNWNLATCNITSTSGTHNIYLKYTGGTGYLFNLNWFKFTSAADKKVQYAQGCTIKGAKVQTEFDKATNLARTSDIAVVVLGTDLTVADEGTDRSSLDLPGVQEQLLQSVYAANPNTVVVLVNGYSLSINWTNTNIPGIIAAWYGGQAQGTAIADVLFGDYNPGGKLSTTWFKSTSDLPSIDDYNVRHNRTYMYFTGTSLYPFGYGLSYTSFAYSNLQISSGTINTGGSITVSADVQNTGSRAGDEVAQLYVHDVSASVQRPAKELKGFQRVTLQPSEKKTVTFTLPYDALAFFNSILYGTGGNKWVVENGAFDLMVGSSSSDIRLSGQVTATGGVTESSRNIALNKTATADNAVASEPASEAVDGTVSYNSKWCATGAEPHWLKVDLGASYPLYQFVVKHAASGGEATTMNTKDFKIQTSPDGTTWTDRVTVTGNTANVTYHPVTAVTARYIRLYITKASQTTDTAARIYEFEAYTGGSMVGIKCTGNGKYVCADNSGASPLIANRTAIGVWETFEKIDLGGGKIALKALITNGNACADNGGANPLIANRFTIGPWETYNLVDLGNGKVAFLANANSKYVCADNSGANPLIAKSTTAGTWETFELIPQ
jgi:beta-glucosidase